MTLKTFGMSAAVMAMLATPAVAQQREHRGEQARPQGEQRQENRQQNREQQQQNRETRGDRGQRAQPRTEAAPAPRAEQRADPRTQQRVEPRALPAPRQEGVAPRALPAPRAEGVAPRAIPRAYPRVVEPRGNYGYGYGSRYSYGYRPWYGYRGYDPFRPYFFRPRLSIGFGIYMGYPVSYYAYPYAVPVYGYGAPSTEVYVGPNAQYGGIALEIQPDDGYVYVDGGYAGIVRDFDGSRQPLTLTPGPHHIEVDQNGFEPLTFDVTVQPGQVIPYQGQLRPY